MMKLRITAVGFLWILSCLCCSFAADLQYGPIREGQTLWGIAADLQSSTGLTTAELVERLYRENPNAFLDKDIDRLRVGVSLRLPFAGETTGETSMPDSASPDSLAATDSDRIVPVTPQDPESTISPSPVEVHAPQDKAGTAIQTQPDALGIAANDEKSRPQGAISNGTKSRAEPPEVAPNSRSAQRTPLPGTAGTDRLPAKDALSWVYFATPAFILFVLVVIMLMRQLRRRAGSQEVEGSAEGTVSLPEQKLSPGSSKPSIQRSERHAAGHEELPTEHHDPFLAFLHRILKIAAYALAIAMLLVIVEGVVSVLRKVFLSIVEPPYLIIPDIVDTFGVFLAVLIAYEIFSNITLYIRTDVFPVKLVIATALMAIARKVIVLDDDYTVSDLMGIGAVLLSLGVAYWLISHADLCGQRDRH